MRYIITLDTLSTLDEKGIRGEWRTIIQEIGCFNFEMTIHDEKSRDVKK